MFIFPFVAGWWPTHGKYTPPPPPPPGCVPRAEYFHPDRLGTKLRQEQKHKPLESVTFDDVREYLHTDTTGGTLGKVSLSDLRRKFQSNENDAAEVHEAFVQKRSGEQVQELQKLKIERAKLRAIADQEERALLDELRALERTKQVPPVACVPCDWVGF